MQPLQDEGELAAQRRSPAAEHSNLRAAGFAKMPVVYEGSVRVTDTHGHADGEVGIRPDESVHPVEER
jgi:hypothetical protein